MVCVALCVPQEVYRAAQSLISRARDDKEHGPANIQSGWALIGAYISLGVFSHNHTVHVCNIHVYTVAPPPGPTHVRSQLRSLLALWRSSFPRSMRELGEEQNSGTLNSWSAALETRTGALACEPEV